MSVHDFCFLCTDDQVEIRIYDMNDDVEDEVFVGTMRDAMYGDFADYEVDSFDYTPDGLILNIDTTEEDD